MSDMKTTKPQGLLATVMKKNITDSTGDLSINSALGKRKQRDSTDIIDLTEGDDDSTPVCNFTTPTKRTRTAKELISPKSPIEPTTPPLHSPLFLGGLPSTRVYATYPRGSADNMSLPIDPPPALGSSFPTPSPSPEKMALYKLPELADRYIAKGSVDQGVEYSSPQKFTLKPAHWRSWKPKHYAHLAEHIRNQFDPIPFAKDTGMPIDEIQHVFSGLVCNPLYFAAEAKKRGEEGMQEITNLYCTFGTPMRPWGKTKKLMGELHGISATKSVEVIVTDGIKAALTLENLSDVDVKYLKQTLTEKDSQMLFS